MARQRRRSPQVTCWCGAYEFPHRIGSGRCSGRDWVRTYFERGRWACECCAANTGLECEVAVGQEAFSSKRPYESRRYFCQGYHEHLHAPAVERWPPDIERERELAYERECERLAHAAERDVMHEALEDIPF